MLRLTVLVDRKKPLENERGKKSVSEIHPRFFLQLGLWLGKG